jgi:protein-S-isoprenylcysteine O-methyltransferase Ste14
MSDATKPPLIVMIPSPIWLIAMIIVALLLNLALHAAPIVQHRPAGIALILAGVALAAWGRLTFLAQRAEIVPGSQTHRALIAAGPFRFTRNPMYLGLLTIGVGAALVAGTWLMWLVPVLLFVLDNFVIVPFEERSMDRTFGDAYRRYRAAVRRWL